jgi:hypothetical protein
VKWLGHRDLSQVATADGYRWTDHLVEEGYPQVRPRCLDCRAVGDAGFMVKRRKLAQKPLLQIKVRDVVDLKAETAAQPRQEGFTLKKVTTILIATVATPWHLISVGMRAGRGPPEPGPFCVLWEAPKETRRASREHDRRKISRCRKERPRNAFCRSGT